MLEWALHVEDVGSGRHPWVPAHPANAIVYADPVLVRRVSVEREVRHMRRSEKDYIANLQRHASDTRALLSNAQKPERERMVVRAFLRCVGVQFSDDEIQASKEEPVDVVFRSALFQVMDILGGRKRGLAWSERQRRYQTAKRASDLLEPWIPPGPLSFGEVSQVIAEGLAKKASHYGVNNCSKLDALLYVDLSGRYLWPPE